MGEGAGEGGPDAAVLALNTEVAALLGQCLLRLQYYEIMLKGLVAEGAFAGAPEALGESQSKRRQKVQGATLGGLVTEFVGTVLGGGQGGSSSDAESAPSKGSFASSRFGIAYPPETYAEIEAGLRELVALRNHLVHGFLAAHDLTSVDGCGKARDRLLEDLALIDRHRAQLKGWVAEFMETRKQLSLLLQDPEVVKRIISGEEGDVTFTPKPSQNGRA